MRKSFKTFLLLPVFATAFLCLVPASVRAQICAGSTLRYVVRDAQGRVMDPSGVFERKGATDIDELKDASKVINKASAEKTRVMRWRGMCNFREDVKESLKLDGKVMNVIFLMPRLSRYDSRSFLVDSLPFREGTYEIDLTGEGQVNPAGGWLGQFYAAKGWKKIRPNSLK